MPLPLRTLPIYRYSGVLSKESVQSVLEINESSIVHSLYPGLAQQPTSAKQKRFFWIPYYILEHNASGGVAGFRGNGR